LKRTLSDNSLCVPTTMSMLPSARPFSAAVHQRLIVLFGQQRGRRQEGHLLAAHHRHESGPQRDLGLAEADVAADQAVHRLGADQILDHGMDGCLLVGRFLEAEVVGEDLIFLRVEAERMALAGGAPGVDVEQLGGDVAHLLGRLALGLVPLAAAQLVQGRLFGADAGIVADQVQLAHRHVERGLVGILQVQELLKHGRAIRVLLAHVHVDESPVASDAVLGVHHGISHLELAQVLDQRLDVARLLLPAAPAQGGGGGEQLGFGDEVDALLDPGEAAGQACRGHAELLVAQQERLQRFEGGRVQPAGAHEVEQALAPALAFGHDQHAVVRGTQVRLQPGQWILRSAHHGQVGQLLREGVVDHVIDAVANGQLGQGPGQGIELLGRQEQALGRQGGALGVAPHQAVALLRVLPEALERRLDVAVQHQRGAAAQVVEHRGRFLEEQRQVILDARGGHAQADVLVDAALGGVALEQLAPAAAKQRTGALVERKLAAGQQAHLGHRIQAALGVGVEGADGVDLVVEEVDAERLQRSHRKQVDEATADRVLAGSDDLRDVVVAGLRKLCPESGLVQSLPDLEVEGVAGQERRRRQPVQRGGGRHQHDVGRIGRVDAAAALVDAPQGRQPLADQVLVRGEAVVGQGFPVGEQRAAQPGCEERDFLHQPLGVGGVGSDDGRQAAFGLIALGQPGQQQGVGAADRSGQLVAFAGGEFGQIHGRVANDENPPTARGGGYENTILECDLHERLPTLDDACRAAARAYSLCRHGNARRHGAAQAVPATAGPADGAAYPRRLPRVCADNPYRAGARAR
jgi:hypothetical protein